MFGHQVEIDSSFKVVADKITKYLGNGVKITEQALLTDLNVFLRNLDFPEIPRNSTIELLTTEECCERYKIIVNELAITIKEQYWSTFLKMLVNDDVRKIHQLADVARNTKNSNLFIRPCPSNLNYELSDEMVKVNEQTVIESLDVDKRFEGTYNQIVNLSEALAKKLKDVNPLFAKDGNKVKDYDGILSFYTEKEGLDVEFFLAYDRILPNDGGKQTELYRPRLDDEGYEELFGYVVPNSKDRVAKLNKNINLPDVEIKYSDDIKNIIFRINEVIKTYVDRYNKPEVSDFIKNQVIKTINQGLIPGMLSIQLAPYAIFGGDEDFSDLDVESTPNLEACFKVADKEVNRIIDHLKSIPLVEDKGIAYYAIDTDGLGIYGMSSDGVPVQAVVDPKYVFAGKFSYYYTQGYAKFIYEYIKTIQNKYFFNQIGKIETKEKEPLMEIPEGFEDATKQEPYKDVDMYQEASVSELESVDPYNVRLKESVKSDDAHSEGASNSSSSD